MTAPANEKSTAAIIAAVLAAAGVTRAFTVPGESFLPVLDALATAGVDVTPCRHEGGASFMAHAHARLTGEPGVCLVSRGPGAANASIGAHEAAQSGTPMLLLVGQVATTSLGRGAFQEVDLEAMFAPIAKATRRVDKPEQAAPIVSEAVEIAQDGRAGPVVVVLPVDVLPARTDVAQGAPALAPAGGRPAGDADGAARRIATLLDTARRPTVIVGGGRWSTAAAADLRAWAERARLPVAAEFRCQDYLDHDSPAYIGELGVAPDPALAAHCDEADVVLALGAELGDISTQGYRMLADADPDRRIVQVHPAPRPVVTESPVEVLRADPVDVVRRLAATPAPAATGWAERTDQARARWREWTTVDPATVDPAATLGAMIHEMSRVAPRDTVVGVGAGNYTAWVQRYWRFHEFGTQLAPRSGSMGYGLPAAVAAALLRPTRPVVSFAGDGCFLMTAQELATAAQHRAPIISVVVNNGMYGTIRMHQERQFPGHVVATSLENPDFEQLGASYGCWTARVRSVDEATAAFATCLDHPSRLALIEMVVDPVGISPTMRLARGGGLTPA